LTVSDYKEASVQVQLSADGDVADGLVVVTAWSHNCWNVLLESQAPCNFKSKVS